jgi:predicted HicB family RNase H-like nuclease
VHNATLRNVRATWYTISGGDTVAERKAKWQNDYILRTYDRINLTVPKGDKARIQAAAEAAGQSVNAYINQAINARIAAEAEE